MTHLPKSRPVLVVFSILAGLQVMAGGAALGDVIGLTAYALFGLGVGAVQAGMTFYVQSMVVPVTNVAAYDTGRGIVAGPATVAQENGRAVTISPVPELT